MKNKYETPEIKVLSVDFNDVITTSTTDLPNDNHPGDNEVNLGI